MPQEVSSTVCVLCVKNVAVYSEKPPQLNVYLRMYVSQGAEYDDDDDDEKMCGSRSSSSSSSCSRSSLKGFHRKSDSQTQYVGWCLLV